MHRGCTHIAVQQLSKDPLHPCHYSASIRRTPQSLSFPQEKWRSRSPLQVATGPGPGRLPATGRAGQKEALRALGAQAREPPKSKGPPFSLFCSFGHGPNLGFGLLGSSVWTRTQGFAEELLPACPRLFLKLWRFRVPPLTD